MSLRTGFAWLALPFLVGTVMAVTRATLGAWCVEGFDGCPDGTSVAATQIALLGLVALTVWALLAIIFGLKAIAKNTRHPGGSDDARAD